MILVRVIRSKRKPQDFWVHNIPSDMEEVPWGSRCATWHGKELMSLKNQAHLSSAVTGRSFQIAWLCQSVAFKPDTVIVGISNI